MGKMKGAAECSGHKAPILPWVGWRARGKSSTSRPKGEGVVLVVLGGGKRIFVILGSDFFIRVFMSLVIMCAP